MSTAIRAASQRGFGARERRVEQKHQPVAHVTRQSSPVGYDDLAQSLMIIAEQTHHFVGSRHAGKCGEAAEVAEDNGDFATMGIQKGLMSLALEQLGDLR